MAAGIWLVVWLGCDDDRPPPAGRGVEPLYPAQSAAENVLPEKNARPASRVEDHRSQLLSGFAKSASGAEPAKPEPEKRDFEAELKAVAGNPIGCMKQRSDDTAPDTVRISLEAHVTSNGVITRSYAGSSSLTRDELDCIRKRVERGRFRAPVDDAPRSVSATLEVRRVPNSAGPIRPGM